MAPILGAAYERTQRTHPQFVVVGGQVTDQQTEHVLRQELREYPEHDRMRSSIESSTFHAARYHTSSRR